MNAWPEKRKEHPSNYVMLRRQGRGEYTVVFWCQAASAQPCLTPGPVNRRPWEQHNNSDNIIIYKGGVATSEGWLIYVFNGIFSKILKWTEKFMLKTWKMKDHSVRGSYLRTHTLICISFCGNQLSTSGCPSVRLSNHHILSKCLLVCFQPYLPTNQLMNLPTNLPVFIPTFLPTYLPTNLHTNLSTYLPTY